MKLEFPYGKQLLSHEFAEGQLQGVLTSELEEYVPGASQEELIDRALEAPIGSMPLWKLAQGKNKVVIIASDHTRPVPSKLIMPRMLDQIRRGNPHADITILTATVEQLRQSWKQNSVRRSQTGRKLLSMTVMSRNW